MKTKKHIANFNPSGFTLLELVLMMSLIAIVSVGVYSNISPRSMTMYVDAATLKVVHDIRFAQDRAMVTGRNHGFRSYSNNQYEIYDTSAGHPITDPSTQSDMVVSLGTDYPNVNFAANYQVEFDSLGSPVIGGGGSITLSNGTESKSFSLTSNTGLINLP